MKKGLVISYFFPPNNSSEGNVTFKLINSSKFRYSIFFNNLNSVFSYGQNSLLINKSFKLIYSNSEKLKDFKSFGKKYFKNNILEYDFIMSRSMPLESHLIGLLIKKYNPKKLWVASFGDPIANNPYEIFAYSTKFKKMLFNIKNHFRRKKSILFIKFIRYFLIYLIYLKKNIYLKYIQNKIFKKADIIIFNNDEQKNYMLGDKTNIYQDKILILPHSYEKSLFDIKYQDTPYCNKNYKKEKINNIIKILYAGHIDSFRSIHNFLEALFLNIDLFKNKLIFEIIGTLPKKELDFIKEKQLEKFVFYKKNISYEKSLQKMKNSNLLLHIDALFPTEVINKNIFFAAKVADYLGSGVKILGITSDGPSKRILKEYNHYCIENNITLILNFLFDLVSGNIDLSKNSAPPIKYSSKYVARIFDNRVRKELIK